MAEKKKSNKNTNTKSGNNIKKGKSPEEVTALRQKRIRNIRLLSGFLLLLLGLFFTVSILSYIFSWKDDQNTLLSSRTLSQFLFVDKTPVTNWCGRLGAAIAHILVYRALGIAALLFTVWIAAIGLNLVYARHLFPTRKWIRIMAMGFLFFCPFFAYCFPHSGFPLGGALGTSIVQWTRGFAGPAGTLFTLITTLFIFVFIVFQFDIKPYLDRIRKIKIRKPQPVSEEQSLPIEPEIKEEMASTLSVEEAIGNKLNLMDHTATETAPFDENGLHTTSLTGAAMEEDDEEEQERLLNLELNHKSTEKTTKDGIELELPQKEADLEINPINTDDDRPATMTPPPVPSGIPPVIPPVVPLAGSIEADADRLPDNNAVQEHTDMEIKTNRERPAVPKNGEHISIADNQPYDPSLDLPDYNYPTLDLLSDAPENDIPLNKEELQQNKEQIVATLRSFGIEIQKIMATVGPTVTLYEIIPAEGVRISKIRNLEDDIALNLAALGIRIIAPIPGRGTIGIEVPNRHKQIVAMKTLIASERFVHNSMSLPIALGKKIDNENYIVDLATMPHLLMAGATGQGKSVGINAILVSLLYKKHPSQLKFVMVDPKKVELSIYRVIEKHFLAKLPNEEEAIITDTKKVVYTLNALGIEMDNRYELLKDAGARNIKEYNQKFIARKLNPNEGHKFLPFIVLVIDEFADLIMTAGKEIEMPIARLAQLARAVGIHLIIATQRPSVNIITGIIKANFPARVAFRVTSKIDSRTILDAGGADQLVGRGDMLISTGNELIRLQCAFVDTPEVERIVSFIGNQKGYPSAFELPEYEGAEDESIEEKKVDLSKRDKMFEECARMVVNSQSGSTSMLQRKFNLGYNRAGRIMDQLEAAGIVGPSMGSKPREVMYSTEAELNKLLEVLSQ